MQDAAYWTRRAARNLIANEKTAVQYERDLQLAYKRAYARMEADLRDFYARYAKENKMTLSQARKSLSNTELKSFKQRQLEYLEEVERNGNNPQYAKQLRQMSARAYVTKMDEIQANIRHHVEMLSTKYDDGTGNLLRGAYEDSYYKTVFDVSKQANVSADFTALGSKQLDTAVKEKWSGANYSDRIWQSKQKLVAALTDIIPQEFARGRGVQQIANDFAARMNVSYKNALRLVRTEINYISNKATLQAYRDSGVVQEFEFVATLDMRTSEVCQDMDGRHFPLAEGKTGINIPPLHPYCRSTTIPYFPADEFGAAVTDRVGRDETGKSTFMGKDMSYLEWAQQYTSASYVKRVKANLTKYASMNAVPAVVAAAFEPTPAEPVAPVKEIDPVEDYLDTLPEDERNDVRELLKTAPQNIKDILAKYADKIEYAPIDSSDACFRPTTNKTNVNFKEERNNARGAYFTLFHETGHAIDFNSISGWSYASLTNTKTGEVRSGFADALRKDYRKYIKSMKQDIFDDIGKDNFQESYLVNKVYADMRGGHNSGVSDITDGLSSHKYSGGYGHKGSYWKNHGAVEKEAFAHMFAATTLQNSTGADQYAALRRIYPTAFSEFDAILAEIGGLL